MKSEVKSLYLCIHVLQVAPVSCINRDDTGSPKTCIYGGTVRMRVSSQCWKRAVRMFMKDRFGDTGVRTKHIVMVLSKKLSESIGCDLDEATEYVKKCLISANIISDKASAKDTAAFFSDQQIANLSELINNRFEGEKNNQEVDNEKTFNSKLQNAVKHTPAISELLFGRMFASNADLNYDAACQVAHAFSVNEVYEEPDYFTVVGDVKKEETNSGSDYLDTRLFNSGVLYRFSNVNLSQGSELRNENYKVDAAQAARRYLEAFVLAMPTGSINSYANMTLPETVIIELRDDIPISFAPAFAKAVEGKDICALALEEMVKYEDKTSRLYGEPVRKWVLGDISLKEICEQVEEEISRRV